MKTAEVFRFYLQTAAHNIKFLVQEFWNLIGNVMKLKHEAPLGFYATGENKNYKQAVKADFSYSSPLILQHNNRSGFSSSWLCKGIDKIF